ncbi:MAG: hypothetical protein WC110_06705 [Bacteroidales bacterium]|jgi:hypothetical protein|nr:hypothetical protein [Bacteroidales bacterium]
MIRNIFFIIFLCLFAGGCSSEYQYIVADRFPPIFPDYIDVTVPSTIAPLNFMITATCSSCQVSIKGANTAYVVKGKNKIRIPLRKWKKALETENILEVTVSIKENRGWIRYRSFHIYISEDPIDDILCYRRIMPGYAYYNFMGIYQREISTFREKTIVENTLFGNSCLNCHAFAGNDPRKMQLHIRGTGGGTLIIDEEDVKRIDTRVDGLWDSFRYPYWHPDGRYIAYSINNTSQTFHNEPSRILDVFDTRSDIIIYDVEQNKVLSCKTLMDSTCLETFPAFSADGKTLYFCSAPAPLTELEKTFYSLKAVSFDPQNGQTGDSIINIYTPKNGSTAFPRPSHDGRYITFTLADYGTFPIWHKEADIWILNTDSGQAGPAASINSENTESYHTWSSNSKWLAFASRRTDGLYTRIYIAHMNEEGIFSKPFLLPQKNPGFYSESLQSYNIPEFVSGTIKLSKQAILNSQIITTRNER